MKKPRSGENGTRCPDSQSYICEGERELTMRSIDRLAQ